MSARGPSPFIRSALRQIRQTLPRFLSILIITALGVAFFAGLRLSGPYMQESANRYFAERNFMDIEVLSTLGFDEDDIAALRATPGVTDVFAAYSTDVMLDTGDGKLSIHLISLDEETDAINAPLLKEGRLPRASGECLAEPAYLEACGKQVGDTIVFQSGTDAPLTDTLTTTEFTIVGAAVSPLYVSEDHGSSNVGDGHTDYFFALLARDFTLEVATEAYVIAEKSEAFRLDERYLDDLAPVVDALKATGAIRGPERYNTLLAEGTAELEDARAEVADGYQELIDAQKELEDARKELDDGWSELADARAELDDGWSAYNAGAATASQRFAREQRRLDEGLAQYEEGLEQWQGGQTRYESGLAQLEPLRAGIAQLDEGIAQVDGAIAALDPANPAYAPTLAALEQQKAELLAKRGPLQAQLTAAQAELASSKALLDSTKAQLDEARAELDSGSAQLAAARASTRSELATAKRELLDGEEKYRSGQQELQDGEDSYTSGLAEFNDEQAEALIELADAEQEIADGQEKLDKLESPTWHVLDLSMNAGFASYKDESKQLDAIALVIPLLFFLIAALVSMTSMTRLVDSDRTIIGTYKALGYRTISIAARYLFYSISASLIGSVIGVLVGFNLFPPVIFSAFQMMFTIPPAPLLFSWPYALISGGIAVLCAAVPAFLVSLQTMREVPAESMRPFTPTKGKRTLLERFSFLWRHLSFLHKITIRNLFRYKKRLFMTILGVAGCTALMFTGFGLRDSLSTVGPKQFGEIHRYDVQIDFKQDAPQEQIDDFLARLDDTGALLSHTALYQEAVEVVSENTTKTALLTVPQDMQEFADFMRFQTRPSDTGAPAQTLELDNTRALVSEQLANQFGLASGSTITLRDFDDKEASFEVGGAMENYVYHYIYLSPSAFTEGFKQAFEPNQLVGIFAPGHTRLPTAIEQHGIVTSVTYSQDNADTFANTLNALQYVVLVLIVSAAALVFVVLFSLTTINLEERSRELASLEVLGFYDRELAAYIYRESFILTTAGIALGLGLGVLLERYIITTMEIDVFMFSRDLLWPSFVLSALLTAVFALAVNLFMYRSITSINMVSSLKNVE